MFKKIPLILILIFLCAPVIVSAQTAQNNGEIIEAEVIEIMEEREISREDGSAAVQQNIKLKGLIGEWKEKGFIFKGISDLDVVSSKKVTTLGSSSVPGT